MTTPANIPTPSDQPFCEFSYDPDTGEVYKNGRRVGWKGQANKYYYVKAGPKSYKRARFGWFLTYGCWPSGVIDHINGDSMDDRIENLRDVSYRVNNSNMARHRSGYLPGTTFDKEIQKWFACIKIKGKSKNLGYFPDQKSAHQAYLSKLSELGL